MTEKHTVVQTLAGGYRPHVLNAGPVEPIWQYDRLRPAMVGCCEYDEDADTAYRPLWQPDRCPEAVHRLP